MHMHGMQVRVLTFSSGHADALGFDLKAKASLVFPQSRRDSGFHSGWSNLTTCVKGRRSIALGRATRTAIWML